MMLHSIHRVNMWFCLQSMILHFVSAKKYTPLVGTVQGGPNVLLPPCKISAAHNVKYIGFKKLSLFYFSFFQTSLVVKFMKLNLVYLQRF